MKVKFSIDYRTVWGQRLYVSGNIATLGSWTVDQKLAMTPTGGERWELEVELPKNEADAIEYKYLVVDERYGTTDWEFGDARSISNISGYTSLEVKDFWRPTKDPLNNLYTAPFKNAFFARNASKPKKSKKSKSTAQVRFQIRAPRVGSGYSVCVIGSHEALGNWDEKKALVLSDDNYPVWSGEAAFDGILDQITFKFGIYDAEKKQIVTWETGDNRVINLGTKVKGQLMVWTDEYFRYPVGNWKASGVAIPVFSIRTANGCGVGEFSDIKLLVDWAKTVGMKMVQVLPVNDTVASKTWVDSYPYAAVSVYALHPIYGNLTAIGPLKDKARQKEMETTAAQLNTYDHVAYEEVMAIKSKYYKWAFDEQKATFLKDPNFLAFFERNEHWLVPYAAFSYLRDKNKTVEFKQWGDLSDITLEKLTKLTSPKAKHYDDIAVHYFIQYHLDKQLKEATAYAREHGVVLKGDIPIGIYRNSVDAWLYPNLFNMSTQAGAPPDDFSVTGQNWGFPTYNWQEMAKDGYSWWVKRLQKMADYFDVFRIDHILGFFRIWEIPFAGVEGTMGHFNPSIPFSVEELFQRGINFDRERMCEPYIRSHMLGDIFGRYAGEVAQKFLVEKGYQQYRFKPEFSTQRQVKEEFERLINDNPTDKATLEQLRNGLYQLLGEVLFFEAPFSDGRAYNPRVGMHGTYSFKELDATTKSAVDAAYIHYFYKRHNDFWREKAMEKLPAIKNATDMLICGEDLGMVPDCVPGVMDELSILSLAIQRMPNDPSREFWHPADTPYLSVCSPSSHDTSTLRGWWEEDRVKTQRFFNNILGNWGEAPTFCEPWVASQIINQHLHSPSMWAVFPLQDLLAMNEKLRRLDPNEERINVPANPQHYWKYRMHISVEELLSASALNDDLRQMIDRSGRSAPY